jgi:hypothetical protein
MAGLSAPRCLVFLGLALAHLALITGVAQVSAAALAPATPGWSESFDEGWEERWQARRLDREPTRFAIRDLGGDTVLEARANSSASVLVRRVEGLAGQARVAWRWNVVRPLDSVADEKRRAGDDFAARVFVVFGTDLSDPKTTALCYVWAQTEPPGTTFPSPVAGRVQTVVLRSGDAVGGWATESVDPTADYRRLFTREPPPIGAIGLMSDADDTGSRAVAWFDDVSIGPTLGS